MQSLRCSPAIWAEIPHGRDRPSASRFVALSIFILLSLCVQNTHPYATKANLSYPSCCFQDIPAGTAQFLSEKMDRKPRPARAVEPLGHLWYCASTNPTIVHSTFGVAYILLVPHPWFGVFHCPGTPGRNEHSRTPGLGLTWCCPTSSQHHQHPAALTQARTGRHERTCRGVAEAETIISRLWLTATFPFGHSSFPFRFPLWRDPYLGAEESGDALCTYRAPHAERGRPHVSPVHHRNVSYEAWEAQPYTWPEDHT